MKLPAATRSHGRRHAPRDRGAVAVLTLGIVMLTVAALGVLVDVGGALTAKTTTLEVAASPALLDDGQGHPPAYLLPLLITIIIRQEIESCEATVEQIGYRTKIAAIKARL